MVLEPAGALGIAGAKKYLQQHDMKDQTVVAITSGANMDFDRLRFVRYFPSLGHFSLYIYNPLH